MSSSPYLEQAIRQGETLIRYLNLQLKKADELLAGGRKDITMSLDDTLREILDFRKGTTDDRIAQIKQAFADAGYVDIHTLDKFIGAKKQLMTGYEWYDRFQAELKGKHFPFIKSQDEVVSILTIVEDAARRAANLTEDSK